MQFFVAMSRPIYAICNSEAGTAGGKGINSGDHGRSTSYYSGNSRYTLQRTKKR